MTTLATPQTVTVSPSLAACLPRNIPLVLPACPTEGEPHLSSLSRQTPVVQEALGSQQPHKHLGSSSMDGALLADKAQAEGGSEDGRRGW